MLSQVVASLRRDGDAPGVLSNSACCACLSPCRRRIAPRRRCILLKLEREIVNVAPFLIPSFDLGRCRLLSLTLVPVLFEDDAVRLTTQRFV